MDLFSCRPATANVRTAWPSSKVFRYKYRAVQPEQATERLMTPLGQNGDVPSKKAPFPSEGPHDPKRLFSCPSEARMFPAVDSALAATALTLCKAPQKIIKLRVREGDNFHVSGMIKK
jgi:hypothetical protein